MAVCAFVLAVASLIAGTNPGTAAPVTVSAEVASHIQLGNNCTNPAGYNFGTVLPGAGDTTATGAGICSFSFDSNNDSAMLRIGQRDGMGEAIGASSGTWTRSTHDADAMHAIDSYDSTRLMAAGRDGAIARSTNGGDTWTEWENAEGNWTWFWDIESTPGDATVWYAAGDHSVVRVTNAMAGSPPTFTDLFAGLSAQTGWPSSASVYGVAVIDATTVVVAGRNGWIGKGTNLGTTPSWTAFQAPSGSRFYDVDAVDASTIYAVGDRVAYTTLGGDSLAEWNIAAADAGSTLADLEIADSTHIYAVGAGGLIYRCTANPCTNASWQDRRDPNVTNTQLNGVATDPADPNKAWAVGQYGQTFVSSDGGMTWTEQTSATGNTLMEVTTTGTNNVVATGMSNIAVWTSNGTDWSVAEPNPIGTFTYNGVASSPLDGRIVAVGSEGQIRRSTDGGANWTSPASGTSRPLFDVTFANSSVAWVVGERGTILRSTDGGVTWSAQASGVTRRLWGVDALDERTAIAVGDLGTVVKTTDRGVTWRTIDAGTTANLKDVTYFHDGRLALTGRGPVIRTSNNGGESWTAATTVPSGGRLINDISAGNTGTAYISADYDRVWKTTDYGVNWTSLNVSVGNIESLEAASDTVVYAGSQWGGLYKSIDGGATFQVTWGGDEFYQGIAAIDKNSAVAVASGGVTARTRPDANATATLKDYGAAPNNWASTGGLFAMCLQDVSTDTSVAAGFTKDTDGGPTCTIGDDDPWRAVPSSTTKIASVPDPGDVGRVDLVWGIEVPTNQKPVEYTATIVFEAVAPNA